jgi:hypothetical protein
MGTIRGLAVPTFDVVATTGTELDQDGGVAGTLGYVVLGNVGGVCSAALNHHRLPNLTELYITIAGVGATLPSGTYPICPVGAVCPYPGPFATVDFLVADASCSESSADGAAGGSVTLTTSNSTELAGTFSVTLGCGATTDMITGSFAAPMCAAYLPRPSDSMVFSCGN